MWVLHKIFSKLSKVSLGKLVVITILVIFASGFTMRKLEPETFPSLFDAIWWTMTTIVTVGYGDFYPTSISAGLLRCCCFIQLESGPWVLSLGRFLKALVCTES